MIYRACAHARVKYSRASLAPERGAVIVYVHTRRKYIRYGIKIETFVPRQRVATCALIRRHGIYIYFHDRSGKTKRAYLRGLFAKIVFRLARIKRRSRAPRIRIFSRRTSFPPSAHHARHSIYSLSRFVYFNARAVPVFPLRSVVIVYRHYRVHATDLLTRFPF